MTIDPQFAKELVGYAASLVILVSLVTTNVMRLRILNGAGSILFGLYGLLIGAIPVCVINWIIAGIDAWFLAKTLAATAYFDLAPADSVGPAFLRRFFLYYERDIQHFTPGLSLDGLTADGTVACVLFRNLLPVGLFAFRQDGDKARVIADYMVPEYRDFKAGRFLYRTKRLDFKERGIRRFAAVATAPQQVRYLRKNGFLREEPGGDRFLLEL